MGWWKPYFFWDVQGVQVLLPSLVIQTDKGWSFLGASLLIAILCFVDRHLAHAAIIASGNNNKHDDDKSTHLSIAKDTLVYTGSRFTSGLVMLVMMSFNAVLYLEVILFVGVSEYFLRLRQQKRQRQQQREYDQHSQLQQEDSYDDGYRDEDHGPLQEVHPDSHTGREQEMRVI